MLQYLGLLLVALSWLGGLYLIRTWRGSPTMSISQHAASTKDASKLFAMILVVGGGTSYIWLIAYFVPLLDLPILFTALLTATFILQIIVALVPDSDSWKRIIHRSAAYPMTALYFPLSYLIIRSDPISHIAQLLGGACVVYMLLVSILFFTIKRTRNKYLILQCLYIIAFQLIILSAAYLHPS